MKELKKKMEEGTMIVIHESVNRYALSIVATQIAKTLEGSIKGEEKEED